MAKSCKNELWCSVRILLLSFFKFSFFFPPSLLILKQGFYLFTVSFCISNTLSDSTQKILETRTGFCKQRHTVKKADHVQREEESEERSCARRVKSKYWRFTVCFKFRAK